MILLGWAHRPEDYAVLSALLSEQFEVSFCGNVLSEPLSLKDADWVVAHSMGGLAALSAAADEGWAGRLVLLSSCARFCSAPDYACGVPERVLRQMILQFRRAPDQVLRDFWKQAYAPDAPPLPPPAVEDAGGAGFLQDGLRYLRDADCRSVVRKIEAPTLLLHGTKDAIIDETAAHWLDKQLPNSSLFTFSGGGHALFAGQADWVARHIAEFARRR
jgi:pimeloyl-[acyl-carrier protein] methyl ester esterase